MAKNTSRRKKDIKSKLVAAICMLLVSTIMMVSSTYAWFTLSTAPEVTGITTAVGANGNLEMALLPTDGNLNSITSAVGDSMSIRDATLANVTWGNLVDLSSTSYGLDKIMLLPSKLNATLDANKNPTTIAVKGSILKTPEYGSDGRVTELVEKTVTSVNGTDGFVPNSLFGVRAVGVSSGMTERQLAYRNARAAASTAMTQAKNEAAASLKANGNTLANIAVKKATSEDATYGETDVDSMQAIVTALTDEVLPQIEQAYMQYILAYAASYEVKNEYAWSSVKNLVEAEGATLASVVAGLANLKDTEGNAITLTLPTEVTTALEAYNDTLANVTAAQTEINGLYTRIDAAGEGTDVEAMFGWDDINDALYMLANVDSMTINGQTTSELMDNMSDFVNDVLKNGLTVTMATGGGVYADIADHCGDYNATVVIDKIEYNGLAVEKMNAKMQTATTVKPAYLEQVGTGVQTAGAPESTSTEAKPISDMYGYVIDLAFRTNAATSSLKLQVEAADRIYADNTNEQTMGGGSSMTFKSAATDFDDESVLDLMECIRIVFFDPDTGTVYATAKLDTAEDAITTTAEGITAEMYIYTIDYAAPVLETGYYGVVTETTDETTKDVTTVTTYINANGAAVATVTVVTPGDGSTTVASTTYDVVAEDATDDEAGVTAAMVKATATEIRSTDDVITGLTQNEAMKVSVLVYLDGESITNADVANAASSMTGTMNLQFASTATLTPMEYGDLHTPGANENVGG